MYPTPNPMEWKYVYLLCYLLDYRFVRFTCFAFIIVVIVGVCSNKTVGSPYKVFVFKASFAVQ